MNIHEATARMLTKHIVKMCMASERASGKECRHVNMPEAHARLLVHYGYLEHVEGQKSFRYRLTDKAMELTKG